MARLIAIEGIDGSGKGTQAARLVKRLQATGHTAALLGFPRYQETFFGARIGDFLNGRFGALAEVDPFLAAALFAGDRFESRELLRASLAGHEYVVLDRYVASNMAHQGAKRVGAERRELTEWIRRLEYEVYGLPVADMTLLLDIPAEIAQTLIAQKARRNYTAAAADLQEADLSYQQRVRDLYLDLCEAQPKWRRVSVIDSQGAIRSIEEIDEEIWRIATLPSAP